MAQVAFNTLDYANKLKAVGLDPKIAEMQAELQAEVLKDLTQNLLATKADITSLKYELLTKLGGAIVGCTAVLGVLITIFSYAR